MSLDPPLVLACFDNAARTLPVVRATGRFGVNILGQDQHELSGRFASKLPEDEKFTGVPWTERASVPVLDAALAWLSCQVIELVRAGDHTIAIGEVTAMDHGEGDPLVFYRGRYHSLVEHASDRSGRSRGIGSDRSAPLLTGEGSPVPGAGV